MTVEQLALDYTERHKGQAAALAAGKAAHRDYRDRAEAALAELIRAGREFTADDLREAIGEDFDQADPNLLPSVIGTAASQRTIVSTGEYRSRRRSRHASRNRVWVGRMCRDQASTD
ncbi:hypothetical protein AB0L13_11290 [Saccharopolyspora shandongensis]|uniref:hypothetical protein n=1 Tax=Saccharopolyspora shandongensis TaxID=418495 RepID=UPI00342B2128